MMQTAVPSITAYLDAMDKLYAGRQQWLGAALLREKGVPYAKVTVKKKGAMKECFANASRAAMDDNLTYVEGYAVPRNFDMAIEHAWVEDKNGNAIEVTWKEPGLEYLGVRFDTLALWRILAETNVYGILGNAYLLKDAEKKIRAALKVA